MYLLAFQLAVISYVYSVILTEPGMILSWWFKILSQLNDDGKLPEWMYLPLIGCFKCVSGQFALWAYLYWTDLYNLYEHIFTICLTIFFAIIIDKIIYGIKTD